MLPVALDDSCTCCQLHMLLVANFLNLNIKIYQTIIPLHLCTFAPLHLAPLYVLPVAHVASCTCCQLDMLSVAHVASCMCCQLHVLQVALVACYMCCQLHVWPVACVASCHLHMLPIACVANCKSLKLK